MLQSSKVSLCIPAYKQTEYLRKTLDSIAMQSYKDYEIIITDDSPDSSVERLLCHFNFGDKLKYFRNMERKGPPENWNEAIRHASGEYIKILHHDDWFTSEDSLQEYVNLLENNISADFGFSSTIAYNAVDNKTYVHSSSQHQRDQLEIDPNILFLGNFIGSPSTTIYRRKGAHLFDCRLKWVVDIDFYINVLRDNKCFAYSSEPLVTTLVQCSSSVTSTCINNKDIEIFEYFYLFNKIESSLTIRMKKECLLFLKKLLNKYNIRSINDIGDIRLDSSGKELVMKLLSINKSSLQNNMTYSNLIEAFAAVRQFLTNGNSFEAERILTPIIEKIPRNSTAHFLMALVREKQGRRIDSQVLAEKAFELDKANIEAGKYLMDYYLKMGMSRTAVQILNKLASVVPDDPELKLALNNLPPIIKHETDRRKKFIQSFFRKGDIVFDVGANVGDKTEVFLSCGAKVICIEPQPDCAAVLRQRFFNNQNVVIEEIGVSEKSGSMNLYVCSTANTISTFSEEWKQGRFSDYTWDKTIPVKVDTLDALIEKYGVPKYCKIDVEGFEFHVLKGLTKQMPLYISFEFAKEMIDTTKQCIAHLKQLGYEHFNVAIGEEPEFYFRDWISEQAIISFLENSEDTWLWGEVYGQHHLNIAKSNQDRETFSALYRENDNSILQELIQRNLWAYGQPLRLHLGCGEQYLDGYINIDYPSSEHTVMVIKADIFADIAQLNFPPCSLDEIRSHHVFEHFSRIEALALLIEWHQWLKLGGKLHIETPDLIGSAKTLLLDTSWSVKMGVVRHLAGSHEAKWAYHIDQWFPERFEHTLRKLGFDPVQTQSVSWQHEPFLSNVHAIAWKAQELTISELIRVAEELLWESTVSKTEKLLYELWCKQLREMISQERHTSIKSNSEEIQLLESLEKDFRNVEALIRLAEIELQRTNPQKAHNYLIGALALEPQNEVAKVLLEKLQKGEGFE